MAVTVSVYCAFILQVSAILVDSTTTCVPTEILTKAGTLTLPAALPSVTSSPTTDYVSSVSITVTAILTFFETLTHSINN